MTDQPEKVGHIQATTRLLALSASDMAAEIARLREDLIQFRALVSELRDVKAVAAAAEIARLRAQRDELLAALKTLITKMDTIHADKDYRSVWFVNQIHTGRYLGPTYVTELECARAAIAAVEERHD